MVINFIHYMQNKVLITGGTGGIGKSLVQIFYEAGYHVAVNYAKNEESAKELENLVPVKTFKFDVTNLQECKKGLLSVEQYLGGNVDILINNAGITDDKMFHKQTEEGWLKVINTNLISVFNVTHCVIQNMRDNKFGRIINISSVNAHGQMGQTNYSASKAGIEGFTKSLALENARFGITVNAIAPGYINTEMVQKIPQETLDKIIDKIPVGRLGTPEEIAELALLLASKKTGFITGSVIDINGGLHM